MFQLRVLGGGERDFQGELCTLSSSCDNLGELAQEQQKSLPSIKPGRTDGTTALPLVPAKLIAGDSEKANVYGVAKKDPNGR
jgi:hypothetical protein